MQSMELPVIDHFVEPTKSVGRPKSNKLSALAAKRNIGKKNKVPIEKNTIDIDLTGIIDKDTSSKNSGLSASQKLALSQNFRHMVSQVRPGMDTTLTADLVGLTGGLHCKDYNSNDILRLVLNNPSRGMGILFPGRNYCEMDGIKSLVPPKMITALKSDSSFLGPDGVEISCFDFGTSPINDIMIDLKKEQDKLQRRRQKTKRLLNPVAHRRASPKKKLETVDLATIRRLLKKRCNQETAMIPRVVVIGTQGCGKSSLIGKLIHLLDDRMDDKMMTKLRWEAQKAGVPHDCYAWILDQLDCERKFGRSRDVGETMIEQSGGTLCHLFDCPGDFDLISTIVDMMCLADKLVLVVDVTSFAGKESKECKQVENLLRILNETSMKPRDLMVVLNKMDQCQWSAVTAAKAKTELETMMEKTGITKDNMVYIPVSARNSEGVVERTDNDFDGKKALLSTDTFAGCLERLAVGSEMESEPQEWDSQPMVAIVHDTYENMGAGFTAVLYIREGVLVPGQHLVCFPNGVTAQVRSVQVTRYSKMAPVAAAVRGELVHAVLWHVEFQNIRRGCLLCDSALAPASGSSSLKKSGLCRPVETSRVWRAEIRVHNLNGRSVIPGRNVIFHSFSKSCHGYLRRLLWVSEMVDDAVRETNREVTWRPYVVSSANVTLGIELQLDEPHSCLLDRSLITDFTLFDDCSLFASGRLVGRAPENVTETPHDLKDLNSLLYHREMEAEEMEVEEKDS